MTRLRKPTAILALTGAFRDPARRRPNEPTTGAIGEPPDTLSEDQKAAWREIVDDVAPGVFQSSDRFALEVMTGLLVDYRRDPGAFGSRKFAVLISLLARSGMTPADRSRIAVLPPPAPATGLNRFR